MANTFKWPEAETYRSVKGLPQNLYKILKNKNSNSLEEGFPHIWNQSQNAFFI